MDGLDPRARDPPAPRRARASAGPAHLARSAARIARTASEFAVQLAKPLKASQLYNALLTVLAERAKEHKAPSGRAGRIGKPATSSLRILLAEDNAVNQKVALAAPRSTRLPRRRGLERPGGAGGARAAALRRRPDGRPDARAGRARRHAPDLRALAAGGPSAHHRDDRERHARGSRSVLRGRDGRLRRQADPPGTRWRRRCATCVRSRSCGCGELGGVTSTSTPERSRACESSAGTTSWRR